MDILGYRHLHASIHLFIQFLILIEEIYFNSFSLLILKPANKRHQKRNIKSFNFWSILLSVQNQYQYNYSAVLPTMQLYAFREFSICDDVGRLIYILSSCKRLKYTACHLALMVVLKVRVATQARATEGKKMGLAKII